MPSVLTRAFGLLLIPALCGAASAARTASAPPQPSSICEIAKAGRAWAGKAVQVRARLVVDGNGGVLRDDRCPNAAVDLYDDNELEHDDIYRQFSMSFDRELLSVGVSRKQVELIGTVENRKGNPASGLGSTLKLKKVIWFYPEP
jgi:hypothetical protein